MKKIYLFLLGMLTFTGAQAIDLTFWLGDQQLTPGSTVEFNDIIVDEYGTYKEAYMGPDLSISSNIYSSDITLVAECTNNYNIQICAGGSCEGGTIITKENVVVRPNQKLPLQFHYSDEFDLDQAIPVVVTRFTAEDVTVPGSKVEFVLVMGEKGASLESVEVADNLRAVTGGVEYSVARSANLSIYTPDGVCCHSAVVAGEGTVALAPGLYVYTFGNNRDKLLVK